MYSLPGLTDGSQKQTGALGFFFKLQMLVISEKRQQVLKQNAELFHSICCAIK